MGTEIEGKGGIKAKMIEDSIANGIRLCTLQLRFHRFILPEWNTHRMLSRNAASNRAIPTNRLTEQVFNEPAEPVFWGANKKGMQAEEEIGPGDLVDAHQAWDRAADRAASEANQLKRTGVHKQIVNRLLEPFQFVDVLVTATEWENFFNLRLHEDAQPEIYELARVMKEAMDGSNPLPLSDGAWHLPYVTLSDFDDLEAYLEGQDWEFSVNEFNHCLAKISAARCARVSYQNHDQTNPVLEKDLDLAERLLEAGHMSPFEHQARPMEDMDLVTDNINDLTEGETHLDRQGKIWSNNFRGWVQYRALL